MEDQSAPSNAAIAIEYDRDRPVYERCVAVVTSLLGEILAPMDEKVHSITGRVKDRESLIGKISLIPGRFATIRDVNDVAGLRVIVFFEDDVDRVGTLIEEQFDVDIDLSVDKRKVIAADRFGYKSLHYTARLNAARSGLTEYAVLAGIPFEIQVRSIIQHAWAEIEHDLGYKSAVEVPEVVRRKFSRLAALLELADEQFIAIRDEVRVYGTQVSEQIRIDADAVQLNRDSLLAYVRSGVADRIERGVASGLGVELTAGTTNEFPWVDALAYCKIDTIGHLDQELTAREHVLHELMLWGQGRLENKRVDSGLVLNYLPFLLAWDADGVHGIVDLARTIGRGENDAGREVAARMIDDELKRILGQPAPASDHEPHA